MYIEIESIPAQPAFFGVVLGEVKAELEPAQTVLCDVCADTQRTPASELKRRGWHVGRREAFCPACND